MNARSRVALTGRALGIAQPLSQLISATQAKIVLVAALPNTIRNNRLDWLNMIAPTKQLSANHATEKGNPFFGSP
jgi:hypothetical protein